MNAVTSTPVGSTTLPERVVLIGKENVGKSELAAALSRAYPQSSNLAGSTVVCNLYVGDNRTYIDTPGICYRADTRAITMITEQISAHEMVLLVVQATHLDEDLQDRLPLVTGKRGAVAVTFWDKVHATPHAERVIEQLQRETELAVIAIDARAVTDGNRQAFQSAFTGAGVFPARILTRARWQLTPPPALLEHRMPPAGVQHRVFTHKTQAADGVTAVRCHPGLAAHTRIGEARA